MIRNPLMRFQVFTTLIEMSLMLRSLETPLRKDCLGIFEMDSWQDEIADMVLKDISDSNSIKTGDVMYDEIEKELVQKIVDFPLDVGALRSDKCYAYRQSSEYRKYLELADLLIAEMMRNGKGLPGFNVDTEI